MIIHSINFNTTNDDDDNIDNIIPALLVFQVYPFYLKLIY